MGRVLRVLAAIVAGTLIALPVNAGTSVASPAAVAPQTAAVAGTAIQSGAFATYTLTNDIYETSLLGWINRVRVNHGLPRVRITSCADYTAEKWVRKLLRYNLFQHQSMSTFAYGCGYSYVGEIIAMAPATPYVMVRMWMASPGHRAIILDRRFSLVGIGANRDAQGTWRGVADFARP
jgi:uncharacterized protein YkwD